MEDQKLLSLIRASDYDAFDELYNRYWKKMCIIASQKTGCKEDAMDMVQELFIEFWNKREKLVITSTLSNYLISSLYYKIFHHYREKGLQEKHVRHFQEFQMQALQSPADPVSLKEAELQYEQLRKIIEQTIEEMPEKMRQVFQMSRSGKLSVADIAATLEVSPQTVKNQTSNAMKRLREAAREHSVELPYYVWIILLID